MLLLNLSMKATKNLEQYPLLFQKEPSNTRMWLSLKLGMQ